MNLSDPELAVPMTMPVDHSPVLEDARLAPVIAPVSASPTMLPPESAAPSSGQATSPVNAAARVIKRRAPVACRRCRRMRSKCVHNGAKPPCEGCRIAGASLDECVFPVRGAPDLDREYRHPRMRGDKARKENVRVHQPHLSSSSDPNRPEPVSAAPQHRPVSAAGLPRDLWELLPPLEQIIDGVSMFTDQYFQLGFIPRRMFVQQLRDDPRSVSPFLLLGVLSVSARLTPSLVATYGDAVRTAELFMERASAVALTELYNEPTLARCQAFYLLSIAQQGNGYKNKSFINLGIAIRMAILMQLHREETYALSDPTPNIVREAESARRTLWMLYSQDNLHAGPLAPVSLAASDITTLLPSNEKDFINGVLPKTRAALASTPPALKDPSLMDDPHRSLFATLIQSHQLWGTISRGAVRNNKSVTPWDSSSEYAKIQKKLSVWEDRLPQEHRWSPALLKKSKAEGYNLAYLIVPMVTRLSNIIIRKSYIANMLQQGRNKPLQGFWKTMADELFSNVKDLFVQIDIWFKEREPGDSTGAQMGIFCVYSCGLMAAYLCKYPNLCHESSISREAPHMLERTLDILSQSKSVWPLASRWLESLERFAAADQKSANSVPYHHEGSMAEGRDPIPSALHPPLTYSAQPNQAKTLLDDRQYVARQLGPDSPHTRSSSPTGNASNVKAMPRHPPQIRTNDLLLNASVRLPPPHPSPGLVTTATSAAPHYSTAHQQLPQNLQQQQQQQNLSNLQLQHSQTTSQQQSMQSLPQPLPMMLTTAPQTPAGIGAAPLSQPLVLTPPQPQHQPHHDIIGAVTDTTAISTTVPSSNPARASAPTQNNLDLLVQAFNQSTAGLPLPSVDMTYQVHAQPDSSHQGILPPSTVAAVADTATADFYEAPFHNDGYEHELEFMLDGPGVVPGTIWGTGMFGY